MHYLIQTGPSMAPQKRLPQSMTTISSQLGVQGSGATNMTSAGRGPDMLGQYTRTSVAFHQTSKRTAFPPEMAQRSAGIQGRA
jgi:hypothetical protein